MKKHWRSRNKEMEEQEQQELNEATKRADDLDRRRHRLKKDNHFIVDIKRTLGAQS